MKRFSTHVVQSQSGSKKNVKTIVKDHQGKTIAKTETISVKK